MSMPRNLCLLAVALVTLLANVSGQLSYYYSNPYGNSRSPYYYYYYYNTPGGQTQNPPAPPPPPTTTTTTTTPAPVAFYYNTPNYCSSSVLPICPASNCYYSTTRSSCCMSYFLGSDGQIYQACRCDPSVNCADSRTNPTTTTTSTTTTTPTTTTTTPTTTTTTPTTTTTTPTTTTTTPTTTTTTPTTTTTTPTTTITTPTTTTTTPTTTTTAPFRSLCATGFRILNGQAVTDQCEFSGVANLTTLDGTVVSCNAVYSTAMVDGTLKETFVTTSLCKNLIESVAQLFEIEIGNQRYPVIPPVFNTVDGPDGLAYIDVDPRYQNLLQDFGACQTAACPYDAATMSDDVDTSDCKIVSWGTSDATTLTADGLYETSLQEKPSGCTNIDDVFGAANTLCFESQSGDNVLCSGDSGAPIYCKAQSNGEWILMGVAATQIVCDSTPELKVIPIQ